MSGERGTRGSTRLVLRGLQDHMGLGHHAKELPVELAANRATRRSHRDVLERLLAVFDHGQRDQRPVLALAPEVLKAQPLVGQTRL